MYLYMMYLKIRGNWYLTWLAQDLSCSLVPFNVCASETCSAVSKSFACSVKTGLGNVIFCSTLKHFAAHSIAHHAWKRHVFFWESTSSSLMSAHSRKASGYWRWSTKLFSLSLYECSNGGPWDCFCLVCLDGVARFGPGMCPGLCLCKNLIFSLPGLSLWSSVFIIYINRSFTASSAL